MLRFDAGAYSGGGRSSKKGVRHIGKKEEKKGLRPEAGDWRKKKEKKGTDHSLLVISHSLFVIGKKDEEKMDPVSSTG